VERCASTISKTSGLGSMEQTGLGDRRAMIDSCRTEVLSYVMVASTTVMTRSCGDLA
jgi:hypothetical protein